MGIFVKTLSKQSQKGPTYKKGGCHFSTHAHTQRRTIKVRNRKGGRMRGGELRGRGREKEMTVRAGSGWAKEASTDQLDPITAKYGGDNISPSFLLNF